MIRINDGDYSINQIFDFVNIEIDDFVTYIENYICQRTQENSNEIFSDVKKIDNYTVNSNPSGSNRTSLRGRKGIYVFVVKCERILTRNEVNRFNHRWNGAGFHHAGEVIIGIGDHFYQGSSTSKSLLSRLNEHYSNRNDVSSLRLNSSDRSFIKDCLSVFVFPVRNEYKERKELIKMIEKELHNRFPTIAGSSRV